MLGDLAIRNQPVPAAPTVLTLTGVGQYRFGNVTAGSESSIVGDCLVDGTLAVGNSAGRLNVVGDLSLGKDSIYAWEMGSSRCDLVEVSDQLSLADGWTLLLLDTGVSESHGDLLLFTCDGPANLGQVNLDLSQVSGLGFENWRFNDLHVYQDGSDILLRGITVIPEPSALMLLCLSVSGLMAIGRRKRR